MEIAASIKPADKTFEAHRGRLMSVSYRMLGSMVEAEDVMQDAYLRWHRHWQEPGRAKVDNAGAFLTSTVSRLCIDRLRRRRVERQRYPGPWLPEPVPTRGDLDPAEQFARTESINTALLLVLESLGPFDRAVFTLHEVFDYSHREIADLLGLSVANSRQRLHRARRSMKRKTVTGSEPGQAEAAPLVEAFYKAAETGDTSALVNLLCDDVVALSDGGGKAAAAIIPVKGRDRVATVVGHLIRRLQGSLSWYWREVNGQHGLVMLEHGQLNSVSTFDLRDGKIHRLYVMRNPDKLTRFSREAAPAAG